MGMSPSAARNLAELHRLQAEALGPRVALRHKRFGLYADVTWRDYREQVEACAAALCECGVLPGDRVGLLSENRVEWLVADVAMLAVGAVNVPLHAPLTARQVHFQLHDAGVTWLVVSTSSQLDKVRAIKAELPVLRGIVLFDPPKPRDEAQPNPAGAAGVITWRSFLQFGRQHLGHWRDELRQREQRLTGDDLATIMYTSGTTGNPKGVMLTHGNLLSNVESFHNASPFGSESVFLNWLPFSHIYARTVDHYHAVWAGVPLCLAESADTLVRNLAEIQPTHMSSVPRFYEKVLTAVTGLTPEETARRLRGVFGPRLDWLGSGGAPLPPAIAHAFHDAGVLLLQGYGLTESSPVITFNRKSSYRLESVGLAIPGVEVRISADGEVLTRGPHVMKGYWNNPAATAETVVDGWLYTGDLGRLDDDGFLYITGRKKDLIVLSNGKKVAPTAVESTLLADPCIDQAVLYGEGRNFVTALIVPHWGNLRQALGGAVDAGLDEDVLAKHAAVVACLEQRLEAAQTDLAGWEQVKKFVVLPQPFSVAGEEMTVSLKLRRGVIFEKHRAALERLYEE
jgi:long-chain acyl-CoA synthetase